MKRRGELYSVGRSLQLGPEAGIGLRAKRPGNGLCGQMLQKLKSVAHLIANVGADDAHILAISRLAPNKREGRPLLESAADVEPFAADRSMVELRHALFC